MTELFRPRFPWWGGDLQTLRNRFAYRYSPLEGTSEPFSVITPGGDTLTGTLHRPARTRAQPLVYMLHGLTGDEDSIYMLEAARRHLAKGRCVLRMNLRAAGTSEKTCHSMYSGTSWPDVLTTIAAMDTELTAYGIFPVGFSMGGNILINALPHLPENSKCIGAATVSAPIDPASASRRLMSRRNSIYQKALLDEMKKVHAKRTDQSCTETRNLLARINSVWSFDDHITSKRNGFHDAQEYYERTAGIRCLPDIKIPLLMIHAENDPWIPVAPYRGISPQKNITLEITASGGHVGFHGKDPQPWHDLRICDFIFDLL